VVDEVLHDLGLDGVEQMLAFNKTDRVTHQEEDALRSRIRALEPTPAIFSSAVEEGGLDQLREAIRARVRTRHPRVKVALAASQGELLAAVHREGEVLETRRSGVKVQLTARIPEALLGRLRQEPGVELTEV
jgi:GTPase